MINVNFSQYWLVLIIIVLVVISIHNITKMIILISKSRYPKIDKNDILNRNIRNLLISIGLLSVVSLVYIMLVFRTVGK